MIFWVLLGLAVVVVVVTFVAGLFDEYSDLPLAFGGAFLAAILSAVIGGLILLACWAFIPGAHQEHTGTDHLDLRAIGAGNGVHGAFYLGSGYINSTRVLSYITQDGAAVRVGSAPGGSSTIYEDGGKSVDVDHYVWVDPWVFPWQGTTSVTYTFHVPAGSVQDGYEVSSK